ncbi:hypothetical protein AWV79_11935 [Cupriavidus sp. UYMMa02A]|nr:hypothetical protein AWV79_11935 [Cupriavidus sp. UYMMa02A]
MACARLRRDGPFGRQRDIGVVGIRALAAGALSDDGGLHRFSKAYSSLARAEVDADRVKAAVFRQYAEQGESMAGFALRFALSARSIDTVLVGISERSHLDEAVAAAQAGPLEQSRLHAVAERFRELYEMA